jgi:integrase
MSDTPFYLTRAGKQFYERTVPELVKQLRRLNENLEQLAARLDQRTGGIAMPYLSPPTLTTDEQKLILRVTAKHARDHLIISMALGTGLRLGEVVGLNVGDVYAPDGSPRVRVRIRKEIAKGGRVGDVFLPDRLVTKLARFWRFKKKRREALVDNTR